jgi:parallel beta-helix repeat protein
LPRCFITVTGGLLFSFAGISARASILLVPQNYSTISAAVAAAHNGDTIQISPKLGTDPTYHESIVVTTNTLTINGVGGATMDGSTLAGLNNSGPTAIVVSGNGVFISGLTVQNYNFFPTTDGIQLRGSNDHVTGCILSGNGRGLAMLGTTGIASGNTASLNRVLGVVINGTGNTLQGNTVTNNVTSEEGNGGVLVFSGGCNIKDNIVSQNLGDGIIADVGTSEFGGPALTAGYITGNTVNGNTGNGIVLNESENQLVKNNIVSGNGSGIRLMDFTRLCTINKNTVTNSTGAGTNYYRSGIILEDFTQVHACSITQNTVSGCTWDGIEAGSDPFDANGNLSPNTFKDNLAGSSGNLDLEDHSYAVYGAVLNTWLHNTFGTATPGIH